MKPLEVGDLAIVIACRMCPEMVGKCVRLEMFIGCGKSQMFAGTYWYNRSPKYGAWVVSGNGLISTSLKAGLHPFEYSFFGEHLLMPLRGDEVPSESKEEECLA